MADVRALDALDRRLLDGFQRDMPLVPRPFAAMAEALGVAEAAVIARLAALAEAGIVGRVGATVRPNTAGASTLAAVAAPPHRIEAVAARLCAERGVNHVYEREHAWSLWFVATAPDRTALAASLARIAAATRLKVLDLPLLRAFNIDLGFRLDGPPAAARPDRPADPTALRPGDGPILQALCEGLAFAPRPFAALGAALGRAEAEVIERVQALAEAGVLTRVGVIVRHRPLGWRANAMAVWEVPEDAIDAAGAALASHPGVTLAYRRRTVPGVWPYGLFCMVHGRSRDEALGVLDAAAALPALGGARPSPLFSRRCFKQTGALVHREVA
jgi:DNA-binding Lrp family transcriptional regulator